MGKWLPLALQSLKMLTSGLVSRLQQLDRLLTEYEARTEGDARVRVCIPAGWKVKFLVQTMRCVFFWQGMESPSSC
jgi:hypothetical protein